MLRWQGPHNHEDSMKVDIQRLEALVGELKKEQPGPISHKGAARAGNEARIYIDGWNAALQAVARLARVLSEDTK